MNLKLKIEKHKCKPDTPLINMRIVFVAGIYRLSNDTND